MKADSHELGDKGGKFPSKIINMEYSCPETRVGTFEVVTISQTATRCFTSSLPTAALEKKLPPVLELNINNS